MKKYNLAILVLFVSLVFNGYSQNETDAFRYSELVPTGTARASALSGSIGGFGADFTSVNTNPAGLGVYKRIEFTFSPSINFSKTNSVYNGIEAYDFKYSFNIGNLGAVFAIPLNQGKWKYMQLATGFNRLHNYHNNYLIEGPNTGLDGKTTSLADYFNFAQYANGYTESELFNDKYNYNYGLGSWAYKAWLIDPVLGDSLSYTNNLTGVDLTQQKSMGTSGSMNEYVFSMGANYDDIFYIGATLGIPYFNYTSSYVITETVDPNDTTLFVNSFEYEEVLQVNGTGINFKVGFLLQPISFFRIGAAIHTPSYFSSIRESYYQTFTGIYNDNKEMEVYETDPPLNRYSLTTPYRVIGDMAFIFGKYGFINFNYQFTDYTTMQLHSTGSNRYSFIQENRNIRKYYQAVHKIAVGGEINLSPVAFRLGYAYNSNPYRSIVDKDGSFHMLSGGFGIRSDHFFTDFAYVYRMYNDKSVLYNDPNINITETKTMNQYFILTLGIKI